MLKSMPMLSGVVATLSGLEGRVRAIGLGLGLRLALGLNLA